MAVPPTDRGYVEFRPSPKRPGEIEVRVYSDLVDGVPTGLFAVHDSIPRTAVKMRGGTVPKRGRSISSGVCAVFWNTVDNVLEITPEARRSPAHDTLLGVSD
jgi:hypothetical protein